MGWHWWPNSAGQVRHLCSYSCCWRCRRCRLAAAPFGATILGAVAIGQIRRSAGKLYGLPLAVFDALLFPLLLLDWMILFAVAAVTMTVLVLLGGPHGPLGPELMEVLPAALTLGIGLPIIAWIDYRIVRAVWRNVTGYRALPKSTAASLPQPSTKPGYVKWVVVAGCLLSIPVVVLLVALFFVRLKPVHHANSSEPCTTLKSFAVTDKTLATNLVVEDGGWFAHCDAAQTIRLFEVDDPGMADPPFSSCEAADRNLHGRAYLQCRCRVPGSGSYVIFEQASTGTTDWTPREIQSVGMEGGKPDRVRIEVVVEGPGKIWVKDVELLTTTAAYEPPDAFDNVPTETLRSLTDMDAPAPVRPALPAADADGWRSLFDGKSLANWRRFEHNPKFRGIQPSGKVRILDGQIVLPASTTNWNVIDIASEFPKANYEVEFEAMQSAGKQLCLVGVPIGEGLCLLDISDNLGSSWSDSNMLFETDLPVTLAAGQWHKVHLRVADSAEVTVDGVKVS